jgi:hypothetical protein
VEARKRHDSETAARGDRRTKAKGEGREGRRGERRRFVRALLPAERSYEQASAFQTSTWIHNLGRI